MKVLVTGARGMVARAVARRCAGLGDEVTALSRQELNIADRDAVKKAIADHAPDAVINCAAFTDVDGAEANPDASRLANAVGPENLAIACRDSGAAFVTISTDYVFDGANAGYYFEDDTPNPRGVYAQTKFEGEQRVAAANPDAAIVRSGWIYGSGGTNFLSVMHRLLGEGKRIKAISDAFGTPTYADDLAARLREVAEIRYRGIVHVTNSGEGTSYLGFAEKVCEIGGFDRGLIETVSNDDLKRPAPRPRSSKLGSRRLEELGLKPLPDWADALERFIRSEK